MTADTNDTNSSTSSTSPDDAEKQRTQNLPTGAGEGADAQADTASGGAPEDPES
ncbi:hypothetical protein HQQ81_16690 [Microbacteriaceae bacterium VKM Ac-2854]|nr:hypothetical protein [Microbacteriaceae bacterium VKM Ac-2854]